jgi:hypothetical protein
MQTINKNTYRSRDCIYPVYNAPKRIVLCFAVADLFNMRSCDKKIGVEEVDEMSFKFGFIINAV